MRPEGRNSAGNRSPARYSGKKKQGGNMPDNYQEAMRKAKRLAREKDREYFVILSEEPNRYGRYDVCDAETLDTFYMGMSEERILFSTF
jgi:hypothetical protein